MILRHIPNALTVLRLILIAPFLMYLNHQEYVHALYIFFLAGLTDCLDGWLARHFHWQSTFGSFIDPLADKLLVASSFISLAIIGVLPWWLVALVFLRDLSISIAIIFWYFYIQRKLDFQPSLLSKINTLLQLGLVTLCLLELAYFDLPDLILNGLIGITAFTTATSYIHYIWAWSRKAWPKIESST